MRLAQAVEVGLRMMVVSRKGSVEVVESVWGESVGAFG